MISHSSEVRVRVKTGSGESGEKKREVEIDNLYKTVGMQKSKWE